MQRLDKGKVSLVEFISSIKFARHNSDNADAANSSRFARLEQRVPAPRAPDSADYFPVRSAN